MEERTSLLLPLMPRGTDGMMNNLAVLFPLSLGRSLIVTAGKTVDES